MVIVPYESGSDGGDSLNSNPSRIESPGGPCPICLGALRIPKMTRCGHLFWYVSNHSNHSLSLSLSLFFYPYYYLPLPFDSNNNPNPTPNAKHNPFFPYSHTCILRFLLSSNNEVYQKCPLCSDLFHKNGLKSVRFHEVKVPKLDVLNSGDDRERERESEKVLEICDGYQNGDNDDKNGNSNDSNKSGNNHDKVKNENNEINENGNNSNNNSPKIQNKKGVKGGKGRKNERKLKSNPEYTMQLLLVDKESLTPYLPINLKPNPNPNATATITSTTTTPILIINATSTTNPHPTTTSLTTSISSTVSSGTTSTTKLSRHQRTRARALPITTLNDSTLLHPCNSG
jgi:hypothetical protein